MPDYLKPEDVPLDKKLPDDTLLWLRNRNRHDLLAIYEANVGSLPAHLSPGEEAVPEDSYDDMSVKDLKAMLDERAEDPENTDEDRERLAYTSADRKQALIAKLREDDAAHPEAEED